MFMSHPSKAELFRHVERKVAGDPIQADVVAHLRRCPKCAEEAHGMESTLQLSSNLDDLEPTDALTEKILRAARAERAGVRRQPKRSMAMFRIAQSCALAATLIIVTAVSFSTATGPSPVAGDVRNVVAPNEYLGSMDRPAGLTRAQREITTIAGAIVPARSGSDGLVEQAHRRAIAEREADITAAITALEANPGSAQARNVVHNSVERQAETYKSLYINRSL